MSSKVTQNAKRLSREASPGTSRQREDAMLTKTQHTVRAAIDDLGFCAQHLAWALEHKTTDVSTETMSDANQAYIDARRALDTVLNAIAEPTRR